MTDFRWRNEESVMEREENRESPKKKIQTKIEFFQNELSIAHYSFPPVFWGN